LSRGETEETRPRRGRGNTHEVRQDLGKASKRRGKAEAARLLLRGETSASRHTSLLIIIVVLLNLTAMCCIQNKKHSDRSGTLSLGAYFTFTP